MESSDEETQNKESLMEEAIKILNQEGFSLPGDVVDTLYTVGRSNAAARRRGALRAHKMSEFESKAKKIRNTRESSARRNQGRTAAPEEPNDAATTKDVENRNGTTAAAAANAAATTADVAVDTKLGRQNSDEVFIQESVDEGAKATLEREESTESSSTCSASTVREQQNNSNSSKKLVERQDSTSSIESSASSLNKKKPGLGRLESVGSDTGYSTSMENVVQTREAKAENLKNMNKTTADHQSAQKLNNGLRRDLSHDSGFTETGFQSCQSPAVSQANEAQALTTQDFNDVSVSNSDVSERFISSDSGEAHVVTSAASDLTAAEMTSKGDAVKEDGTAVSSRAKLENQESNSTLLRVTNKATDEEVSKEDDYESVSQTSKSSRNDSISTTVTGQQTAASRHAASTEQGLYKERSKLATSQDGTRVAADMSVDQQLTRNQEMNNSEQADDGTNKTETKKTTEKSLTSKSLREEKLVGEDGSISGSVTSSQNMDSNLRCSELDETITKADGSVTKRKDDNATSCMKETSSSEKKSVKQLPYGGGKSTEIVKKTDNSSVSNVSKVQSERNETASGVSEEKHEEDSKSMSSSFSGVCQSEDVVNGLKLKRMQSSENSSESKVKTSRSVSSYSSRGGVAGIAENPTSGNGRRMSDSSDVSNFSSVSKENINPPTYEETMSNLSRHGSVGSLSSGYSRQDSCASSIASSAGAFNERQRQKMLEKDGLSREDSFENEQDTNYGRGRGTVRQDSFSSDSTISADNEYQGREIVHPIRKVDTNVYGRSLTDSSIGQKVNRRATLQGDIVLSDRELRQAREDVRSSIRGRDDSYINRSSGRHGSSSDGRRDKFGDFGVFGSSSFKKEVMSMVDKFFDDDDGDFDIGFGRKRSSENRSFQDPLLSRRRDDNPYTMRDDLSKYRAEKDVVRAETADVEYAASDSGHLRTTSRRRIGDLETDFTDTASDSGHNRFGGSRREASDFNYCKNFGQADTRASSRLSQDNDYQYSHLSNRVSAISADDILQSAGKSIRGDRGINASISDSCENITRSRINNNIIDNRNNANYHGTRDGDYSKFRDSNLDMSKAASVSSAVHSVSRDARKEKRKTDTDDYRTRSLPNVSKEELGRHNHQQLTHSEDTSIHEEGEQWNGRRHRIDTALSWIRGELGVLRTQDKVLMSQFQRCQDSIEELKKQKPWYEVYSDDDDYDDDYEDTGRHWEDWEIDGLSHNVLKGVTRKGYKIPTPIQRKAIPVIMDGKDMVAMARTGSGKTAAFLVPMFENLKTHCAKSGARALIMSPTRELALQTLKFAKELGKYTGLRAAVVLGGDRMEDQFAALHANPDIIIATPGRFMHVAVEMNLKLKSVQYVVFDEADRLFEMGFQEQLSETLNRLPESRQTLLFSATLPKLLVEFAKAGLHDPTLIRLDVDTKLSDQLKMSFLQCRADDKLAVLIHLLKHVIKDGEQTVIFAATKHHVEYLNMVLQKAEIPCTYIYSSLDPTARKISIAKFQLRKVKVMIVTDLAARGIDIPLLDNVINYNFPAKSKLFVHRVGRVARAGRSGVAYSLISPDELPYVLDLHVFLGRSVKFVQVGKPAKDEDGLYGRVPQSVIDEVDESIRAWHTQNYDIEAMVKVITNAYGHYIRSRPPPAPECVKRVKEMEKMGKHIGTHPLFGIEQNTEDAERLKLLDALKSYKTNTTIFEINSTARNSSFTVMKRKRDFHGKVIDHRLKHMEDKGYMSDDDQDREESEQVEGAVESDLQDAFSVVIGRSRSSNDNSNQSDSSLQKKKRKKQETVRDEENYISYRPADYNTEQGLKLGSNFDRAASSATFDITGDDENNARKNQNALRWDRKKKKYVRENNDDPKKKKIKTESGAWIPASYKSHAYKDWVKKARIDTQVENDDDDDKEEEEKNKDAGGPKNRLAVLGVTDFRHRHTQGTEGGNPGNNRGKFKKRKSEIKRPEQIVKERKIKAKKQAFQTQRQNSHKANKAKHDVKRRKK